MHFIDKADIKYIIYVCVWGGCKQSKALYPAQ